MCIKNINMNVAFVDVIPDEKKDFVDIILILLRNLKYPKQIILENYLFHL